MKNSNVKVFTAFTYSILLILILGSITFLVVQKFQLDHQVDEYSSQIVERIGSSYAAHESFSSTDFTGDVKETMRTFGQMIEVVTILDLDGNMLNRFRFGAQNPADDPNPYWQSEVDYHYNFVLYEEQKYDLVLSGANNVQVQILYERVPVELLKAVLQFDTIVILALLVLSFLAFLFIPKRDTEESAWALRSVAEENDSLYQETDAGQWQSEDLPAESKNWGNSSLDLHGEEDEEDEFEHLLGSADDDSDKADSKNNISFETYSWEQDDENEDDVDLSFNDSIAEKNESIFDDDALSASGIDDDSLLDDDSKDYQDSLNDLLHDGLDDESADDDDPFTDLLGDEPEKTNKTVDTTETVLETVKNSDETENKLAYELDENQSEDLIDDLDEGLGDDDSRELDDDAFLQILSLADDQDKQEKEQEDLQDELNELDLLEDEIPEEPKAEKFSVESLEDDEDSLGGDFLLPSQLQEQNEAQNQAQNQAQNKGLEAISASSSALDSPKIRSSLNTLLQSEPKALAVALVSSDADIQDELELPADAEIIPYAEGLALMLPAENVQDAVNTLQKSVSQIPTARLQNVRMGITGISSARNGVTTETALQEAQYALSSSDEQSNISIFDANDQVFNQKNE